MQISWQGVAVFALVVVGAVVAGVFGDPDVARILGGLAGGLLLRFGAIGKREGSASDRGSLVGIVLLLALAGCGGGPPPEVQSALSVTARALVVVDERLTPRYRGMDDLCDVGTRTHAEHDHCMRDWDTAGHALIGSRSALLVAETSLDTWEQSGEGFGPAAMCLATAISELLEGLEAVRVPIPETLGQALGLLRPLVAGRCES